MKTTIEGKLTFHFGLLPQRKWTEQQRQLLREKGIQRRTGKISWLKPYPLDNQTLTAKLLHVVPTQEMD